MCSSFFNLVPSAIPLRHQRNMRVLPPVTPSKITPPPHLHAPQTHTTQSTQSTNPPAYYAPTHLGTQAPFPSPPVTHLPQKTIPSTLSSSGIGGWIGVALSLPPGGHDFESGVLQVNPYPNKVFLDFPGLEAGGVLFAILGVWCMHVRLFFFLGSLEREGWKSVGVRTSSWKRGIMNIDIVVADGMQPTARHT